MKTGDPRSIQKDSEYSKSRQKDSEVEQDIDTDGDEVQNRESSEEDGIMKTNFSGTSVKKAGPKKGGSKSKKERGKAKPKQFVPTAGVNLRSFTVHLRASFPTW
jgi:hypothetical protein